LAHGVSRADAVWRTLASGSDTGATPYVPIVQREAAGARMQVQRIRCRAISGPLTAVNRGQSRSRPDTEPPSSAALTARCNIPSKLVMRVRFPSSAPIVSWLVRADIGGFEIASVATRNLVWPGRDLRTSGTMDCVFCRLMRDDTATWIARGPSTCAFAPLTPIAPGHTLAKFRAVSAPPALPRHPTVGRR
jgi:hypothetical protein